MSLLANVIFYLLLCGIPVLFAAALVLAMLSVGARQDADRLAALVDDRDRQMTQQAHHYLTEIDREKKNTLDFAEAYERELKARRALEKGQKP